MSNVYNSIKDYGKAIDLCNKTIAYFSTQNMPYWMGLSKAIKSNSYDGLGWEDSTLRTAQDAYADMVRFKSIQNPTVHTYDDEQ